jgi:N-carbamoyl-L-amino-acid hydrolase
VIASQAKAHGLTTMSLPSGAGHDAQEMALLGPIGMIFVPSRKGISHSAQEYTEPAHIEAGANVLLHTLLHLDTSLDA